MKYKEKLLIEIEGGSLVSISIKAAKDKITELLFDEEGATAAEYAVIIVGLILAVLGVVLFLQLQSETVFNGVGSTAGQFGKIE